MQNGDPKELNFESLAKNMPTDRTQRVDKKNWGHLCSYHVCS